VIDKSTGEVTFNPRSSDVGKYEVTATVTDPDGLDDSDKFYIEVKESTNSTSVVLMLAVFAIFIAVVISAVVQKRMRRL